MIRLHLLVDGPRDTVAVKRLVETQLGEQADASYSIWGQIRLHRRAGMRGTGPQRKLRFAIRRARDAGDDGLVATADADKHKRMEVVRELTGAREEDRRTSAPFPTAIGVAAPHFEAWLLDDATALREALSLAPDAKIPNVRRIKSPKEAIDKLISSVTSGAIPEVLGNIAAKVRLDRCPHVKETGFREFCDELKSELSSLPKED